MKKSEHAKTQCSKIPQEFGDEYKLQKYAHNSWVYFECVRGAYGLSQSSILANNFLRSRLKKEVYYETETTPGLWRHKWCPIMLYLIVDDFGVEYVGKQNANHLDMVIKKYHNITEYWTGKKMQE